MNSHVISRTCFSRRIAHLRSLLLKALDQPHTHLHT